MIKITVEGPAWSGKSQMAEVIFDALLVHKEAYDVDIDEDIIVLDDNPTQERISEVIHESGLCGQRSGVLIVVKSQ